MHTEQSLFCISTLFEEINPVKVSSIYLFNLLRSQSSHGGVKIYGKTYITGFFYDECYKNFFKNALIVECKDEKKIGLFEEIIKL